ncbi:AGC family protein kinase [Tritrichomonas foetus]|uniref:AGC family protein kinase n=1 Tax=Tritrichomonas foetus TaxID=1144522 RepID=A0A1J4KMB0_9EUKA|nr:AGC family protein kinase [Tritrichomonas foetus]|eukprot:OHT10830.1 AGC family protein kinase [Tritrichomonas foetus]
MQCPPPPSRVKNLRLVTLIGSTRNSLVYVVYVPKSKEKMALKIIHKSLMPAEQVDKEFKIQSKLKHKYIMPISEYFDFQDYRALLMPRALGGSLAELPSLNNNIMQSNNLECINDCRSIHSSLNPLSIAKIMYRVIESIEYLHSQNILHGDIKPANIVLTQSDLADPIPQLIDFGHATHLEKHQMCTCHLMTCIFSAPELLGMKPHGLPSDIWSLAATFIYLITGKEILHLKHMEVMYFEAMNLKLSFESKEWEMFPSSLKDLINKMLNKDPLKRPTATQCLYHPFFVEMLGKQWINMEKENVMKMNIDK